MFFCKIIDVIFKDTVENNVQGTRPPADNDMRETATTEEDAKRVMLPTSVRVEARVCTIPARSSGSACPSGDMHNKTARVRLDV